MQEGHILRNNMDITCLSGDKIKKKPPALSFHKTRKHIIMQQPHISATHRASGGSSLVILNYVPALAQTQRFLNSHRPSICGQRVFVHLWNCVSVQSQRQRHILLALGLFFWF